MIIDLKYLKEKYNMCISGVIHIGAHYGEENNIYDELGIKNRVYFEPLTDNFNVLKSVIGDKYNAFQFALGSETKRINMFVETANNGQSSSILKPVLHLQQYPHIVFNKTEEVTMVRLDDIEVNGHNFDSGEFNFINIDVQGYELEVFKGSKETLKNIDYIYAEINRDEVYENCAKISELEEFLSDYGFKLVEAVWSGGTWGDGLFIKEGK